MLRQRMGLRSLFAERFKHAADTRSACTPHVQTLLVAVLFGREVLTGSKMLSVSLAFAGIVVMFGSAALHINRVDYLMGDGLMLLGVLGAAIYRKSASACFYDNVSLAINAATAEPRGVSPPEAVAYPVLVRSQAP